jgi:hypothetical protein
MLPSPKSVQHGNREKVPRDSSHWPKTTGTSREVLNNPWEPLGLGLSGLNLGPAGTAPSSQ